MIRSLIKRFAITLGIGALIVPGLIAISAPAAQAATSYFNGFETSTFGWVTPSGHGSIVREPSGYTNAGGYANGIASATGGFHARLQNDGASPDCTGPFSSSTQCDGPFTRWGGYESTFPAGGYNTSVDIYLDTAWAATHADFRFDWSSAINDDTGSFLQDYVFNAGTVPTGFIIGTSPNANRGSTFPSNACPSPSTPPNTCRAPVTITSSGWYTFRHTFTDNAGSLDVEFQIFDSTGTLVPGADWTIHTGNAISGVGGHRYGWFVNQEIQDLAIDNARLRDNTGPATFVVDDDGFATAANCNDATTEAYTTIQAAVNDASAGDIIKVCPGSYPELVNVDKNNLTLEGAQAGTDARTHAAAPNTTDDSIVGQANGAFQVNANGVTIDGFAVQGVTSNLNAGIWTSNSDNGTQILNNVIENNVMGIFLQNGGDSQALVQHNLIQDNNNSGPSGGTGIYSDAGLENAKINANKFQENESAITLIDAGGSVVPVTVSNNTVLNDGSIFLLGSYGIDVTANHSTNSNSGGIEIDGDNHDIHLDKNVVVNAANEGIRVADDYTQGPNSEILVEHGGVRKNPIGVVLESGAITGGQLQVHNVKIATTNSKGVVNNDAGNTVIDASNNWWGRSSGPSDWGIGVGSSTSQEVDFFPWALHPNFSAFQSCTVQGTPGDNTNLTGTPGKDVICGEGGNDQIKGLGGRDLLLGGDDNDVLQGGSGNDALIGGNGDDSLQGDQGIDDTGQGRAGTDFCAVSTERCSTTE